MLSLHRKQRQKASKDEEKIMKKNTVSPRSNNWLTKANHIRCECPMNIHGDCKRIAKSTFTVKATFLATSECVCLLHFLFIYFSN